jgi:UDP-hydrolysing UDP-N-acetyl-D-glucosamine 2-epimerase
VEVQIVLAGSAVLEKHGDVAMHMAIDNIPISARIPMVVAGDTLSAMVQTTALGLLHLSAVFEMLKPDVVVTVADRFETMSTAITAAYMNIPLAHVQGGEITGSIDEKVRHSITKLADLHFVASEKAASRVISMGESPETVFVTGCPSIDLAAEAIANHELDFDPFKKYGGVGPTLDLSEGYLVVLQHPVTTEVDKARHNISETLEAIKRAGISTLWFWPNVDAGSDDTSKGIRIFRETRGIPNVHFFRDMAPSDFLRLIYNSRAIIGNSSVGIRECSFLGVPAINIGNRQLGRDRGRNVIDAPHDSDAILRAIQRSIHSPRPPKDELYGSGNAGQQIADLLATCTLRFEKRLGY